MHLARCHERGDRPQDADSTGHAPLLWILGLGFGVVLSIRLCVWRVGVFLSPHHVSPDDCGVELETNATNSPLTVQHVRFQRDNVSLAPHRGSCGLVPRLLLQGKGPLSDGSEATPYRT